MVERCASTTLVVVDVRLRVMVDVEIGGKMKGAVDNDKVNRTVSHEIKTSLSVTRLRAWICY